MQLFKNLDIGFLDIGDYLALGTIFSATDSVCTLQVLNQDETPLLYSVVFGEGVVGLISAYIIKKLYMGRHSTDREVALMILMAYLTYMMAEFEQYSYSVLLWFVMSHYTWHNVTESSRITTKHAFATLSFISEIFIFLYVGMDALDIEKWKVVSKSPRTSAGVTIWWAGLMRGSVSVALAYNQFTRSGHTQLRGNAIMITSTITVVLFSTVMFGLLTKPLIRLLLPSKNLSSTASSESLDPFPPKLMADLPLVANGQIEMLKRFDDSIMRPMFGGRGFAPIIPGSPTEPLLH
ncbi:Sodium/hydrogen exchanger 2 [Hibiscus syriacus]|uniref:Sodium/hydrogen exchanger 2 n=1 Tax=Hibiscus syriacus TaxID=106335 RepID=A0A6A2X7K8_HIBSY|nr:Sodium/hydrogen exchanger 2 [Hibiscus syriacus]